jgi:hypothetical protein
MSNLNPTLNAKLKPGDSAVVQYIKRGALGLQDRLCPLSGLSPGISLSVSLSLYLSSPLSLSLSLARSPGS